MWASEEGQVHLRLGSGIAHVTAANIFRDMRAHALCQCPRGEGKERRGRAKERGRGSADVGTTSRTELRNSGVGHRVMGGTEAHCASAMMSEKGR